MFSEVDLWPLVYKIPSRHHFSHLWHFFVVNSLTTRFCDVTVTFDLQILTNSSSTPSWHLCPNWDEIPGMKLMLVWTYLSSCLLLQLGLNPLGLKKKRADFLLTFLCHSSAVEFSVTLCSALLAVTESWTVTVQIKKTHCASCDGGLLTGEMHWSGVERNMWRCCYLDFWLLDRWIIW